MKKHTFKFFVSKAKAIKFHKPYVKKIFPGDKPQMSFPGKDFENKAYFNISATIPAGVVDKAKKYRFPAEVLATGATGYVGAKIAHKQYLKKNRRKRK